MRVGRDELDIVASEPSGTCAFVIVEVRSRTVTGFGAPEESVDAAKVDEALRGGLASRPGRRTCRRPAPAWRRAVPRGPRDASYATVGRCELASSAHLRGARATVGRGERPRGPADGPLGDPPC